jgi:hypothetical protein
VEREGEEKEGKRSKVRGRSEAELRAGRSRLMDQEPITRRQDNNNTIIINTIIIIIGMCKDEHWLYEQPIQPISLEIDQRHTHTHTHTLASCSPTHTGVAR